MIKHVPEEQETRVGSRKIEVCSDKSIINKGINP